MKRSRRAAFRPAMRFALNVRERLVVLLLAVLFLFGWIVKAVM